MWTLFVISIVFATDKELELRYTRYKEFNSQWDCNNAANKLEKTFKSGEVAMCHQTSKKLDPYGLY